jgi:hypothetical protein
MRARVWIGTFIVMAVAVVAIAQTTNPAFWQEWGITVATGVTSIATVVLVLVAIGTVNATRDLSTHSALQGWILERQGMLATLPAMVVESHARSGVVNIKNKAQAPALNVEYRYLIEIEGQVEAPKNWKWVDAIMAKSADKPVERPTAGTIHAQVRFSDSLGTLYLVERRWLGGGAENAYRLFRRSNGAWEHLTYYESDQLPLMAESAMDDLSETDVTSN